MDTYNKAMSESQITNPLSKDGSLINFQNLISQAPVPITIFKGPNFIVESINNKALEIWDKTHDKVLANHFVNYLQKQKVGYYKYSIKFTVLVNPLQ